MRFLVARQNLMQMIGLLLIVIAANGALSADQSASAGEPRHPSENTP